MKVTTKFKLGSREVVAPALESGQIDVYIEYVGTYLAFLGGTPTTDLAETTDLVRKAADAKGIAVLDPSPADDINAIVVTQETADKYGLSKISDLLTVTDQLVFGGPPECPERPFCIQGLEKTYGLKFSV
jgi:osmoprotectant transport system substrate-binding protein